LGMRRSMRAKSHILSTESDERTVTGRVVDEDGNALSSVTVTLGNTMVQTNISGHFVLTLPPGNHTLAVSSDGYIDILLEVDVQPEEDLGMGTLELRREEGAQWWLPVMIVVLVGTAGLGAFLWYRKR